jgi:hypothetical protein
MELQAVLESSSSEDSVVECSDSDYDSGNDDETPTEDYDNAVTLQSGRIIYYLLIGSR